MLILLPGYRHLKQDEPRMDANGREWEGISLKRGLRPFMGKISPDHRVSTS